VISPFALPESTVDSSCTLVNPRSRGSTHLASRDPNAASSIQPGLFSDSSSVDLTNAITCLNVARTLAATPPLADFLTFEVLPTPAVSSIEDMSFYILTQSQVVQEEAVGTAKMGEAGDAEAVVTPDLLVKDFANLRVADASVIPSPLRLGTTSTVYMIAQKASSLIQAANYTVDIDYSRGLNITEGFHKHQIVADEQEGDSNVCLAIASKKVFLEPGTCEFGEAVDNLLEAGVSAAWVGPRSSCIFLNATSAALVEAPCSDSLPVLCRN